MGNENGNSWIELDTLIPQGVPAPATPVAEHSEGAFDWGNPRRQSALHHRRSPSPRLLEVPDALLDGTDHAPPILDIAQRDESMMGDWLTGEADEQRGPDRDEPPKTPPRTSTRLHDEEAQLSPSRATGAMINPLGAIDTVLEPVIGSRRGSNLSVIGLGGTSQYSSSAPGSPISFRRRSHSPIRSSWALWDRSPGSQTRPVQGTSGVATGHSTENVPTLAVQDIPLLPSAMQRGKIPDYSSEKLGPSSQVSNPFENAEYLGFELPMHGSSTGTDDDRSDIEHTIEENDRDIEPSGRSLFLFGPKNRMRRFLFHVLRSNWMRYAMVALTIVQMVLITIDTLSPSNYNVQSSAKVKVSWIYHAYWALFAMLTLVAIAQNIAFGAFTTRIVTPLEEMKNIWRRLRLVARFVSTGIWDPYSATSVGLRFADEKEYIDPQPLPGPKNLSFFRQSWNRVEAVSIIAFWVWTILQFRLEFINPILLIISGLAHLRVLRLLDYIIYTRIVLQAVKFALPFLQNVILFIVFFLIIFGITGLQSFNSSLRRKCVYTWTDAQGVSQLYVSEQNCGSYLMANSTKRQPFIDGFGQAAFRAKGYTCPIGSQCVTLGGPQFPRGEMSFDNIFNSLELVFIIMSMNSYSPILYNIIDSEYQVSCLFFITGIMVLGVWLINLLVAVMVSGYTAVRDAAILSEGTHEWNTLFKLKNDSADESEPLKSTTLARMYSLMYPFFGLLTGLDAIFQAEWHKEFALVWWEVALAIFFLLEIVVRFMLHRSKRRFWYSKANVFDLFLVIANIVVLGFCKMREVYSWLTFFQLLRFYRLVAALPPVRDLWSKLVGGNNALAGLTVFYFVMTFLASLVVAKMLRGQFPVEEDGSVAPESFYDLGSSFLNLYQITSTENWTDILFFATQNSNSAVAAACMGILFCLWMFASSFLILNFFIAVVSENLSHSGESRRDHQVKAFIEEASYEYFPYRRENSLFDFLKRKLLRPLTSVNRPSTRHRKLDEVAERQFLSEFLERDVGSSRNPEDRVAELHEAQDIQLLHRRQTTLFDAYDTHPFTKTLSKIGVTLKKSLSRYPWDYHKFVAERLEDSRNEADEDLTGDYVKEIYSRRVRLRAAVAAYREINPNFDKSLYVFSIDSKIRIFFQRIVDSSYGERASGVHPNQITHACVQTFLMAATIAMVVNTCVNTPVANMDYTGSSRWSILRIADLSFGLIFLIEFLIKIAADGLHFTPNAYTKSPWNIIDLVALIALWVTFIFDVITPNTTRFIRGFFGLRALRLISYRPRTEKVFRAVFVHGLKDVFLGVIITLGVLIPYSVWGTNLFSGKLKYCNDQDVGPLSDCVDEYAQQLFNEWDVLVPRSVQKQYLDYDNFGHALFTNFGILTLEGWVDVLDFITSIVNNGETNPTSYASRFNGLYSVLFNYLGTVLIMTMFISIVIRSYAESSGTAYLTRDQLKWVDLEKALQIVRPRPQAPRYPIDSARRYLLDHMTKGRNWFPALESWCLAIITIMLLITYYPMTRYAVTAYNLIILICSTMLTCLGVLRLLVMGLRLYLHNLWNPAGLIAILGLTIMTAIAQAWQTASALVVNIQHAFYISVLLLWIPRVQQLDELFLMATTALRELSSVLATWFTLFLTYAIAFTQTFGLVKVGPNTSETKNFRTVPQALILLFTMSTGEGWNEVLGDFTLQPPYCVSNSTISECGDDFFAYFLFITWNIISMYIFANLLISLMVESFWLVHRRGRLVFTQSDVEQFIRNWQRFDPKGSGYMAMTDFDEFMSLCTGYFSLHIHAHDPQWSLKAIFRDMPSSRYADPYEVDTEALEQILAHLPVNEMRRRRSLHELFRAHIMILGDPEGGISFTQVLKLFPLYRDLDPSKVLDLASYLQLRLQLHEARIYIAASFVQRRWRLNNERPWSSGTDQGEASVEKPRSWTGSDSQDSPV